MHTGGEFLCTSHFEFGDLIFEVFPIEHSIRVPAVGYQIRYESIRLIYVPDVESIPEAPRVVAGVDLYIGDGATIARPLLRKRGNTLLGHVPITIQLKWCQRERVHRAIFTHCGSQIVAGDERRASDAVRELGEEHGVEAALAYDGFELSID